MGPDYAKEIATLALTGRYGDGDRGLLAGIVTYCVEQLGYLMTSGELIDLMDDLVAEIARAA